MKYVTAALTATVVLTVAPPDTPHPLDADSAFLTSDLECESNWLDS